MAARNDYGPVGKNGYSSEPKQNTTKQKTGKPLYYYMYSCNIYYAIRRLANLLATEKRPLCARGRPSNGKSLTRHWTSGTYLLSKVLQSIKKALHVWQRTFHVRRLFFQLSGFLWDWTLRKTFVILHYCIVITGMWPWVNLKKNISIHLCR